MRRGEFAEARARYASALEEARAHGLRGDIDRAELNLAMARLECGEIKAAEEGLREIHLRASDPRVAFTAAYHLASSLRRQGRYERASRYAARALERAETLGDPDALAPIHNLLGNLLLARSYPADAMREYDVALRLRESQEGDTRWSRALLLDNLGYCLVLQGRTEEGLENIRAALALAEEIGDRRCVAECHQDLCYALLLTGDLAEAETHGRAALEEAVRHRYADVEENCHYMLGEIGSRTGDLESRNSHFDALQRNHPELPFLRDFLCSVDVTGMITLKR
jgi:tetratricopeptide (TPR) repeat protein